MGGPNRFLEDFEKAASKLKPGEVSQPVLTSVGYHLIKLNARRGDSIDVSHILLKIQQSDSSALKTDRLADQLARIAGSSTESQRFDSAAKELHLTPITVQAFDGQPAVSPQGQLPGVSGWAFGGPQPGETSELLDSESNYFLARLDSLQPGGTIPFEEAADGIRITLSRRARAETLVPRARAFAQAAAASGLEAAAKAQDVTVNKTAMFARSTFVSGLGRLNEAIGAAFALPVGAVSQPIVTDDGVYVLRVDKRIDASRDAFEKQKAEQRQNAVDALRQARVRSYLEALRKAADVKDKRAQINAAARRQSAAS
jgi:peptidyl-prolyl cis-trans isomerase D